MPNGFPVVPLRSTLTNLAPQWLEVYNDCHTKAWNMPPTSTWSSLWCLRHLGRTMVCLDGQGPIVAVGFHWIRANIKIHILINIDWIHWLGDSWHWQVQVLDAENIAECLCKHMSVMRICAWIALDGGICGIFQSDYENKLSAASPTLAQSYHPQGMG